LLYSGRLLKVREKRERGQEETQNTVSPGESIYKSSALIEIICGVFVAGWNFWRARLVCKFEKLRTGTCEEIDFLSEAGRRSGTAAKFLANYSAFLVCPNHAAPCFAQVAVAACSARCRPNQRIKL
jgi:hypothetical protein